MESLENLKKKKFEKLLFSRTLCGQETQIQIGKGERCSLLKSARRGKKTDLGFERKILSVFSVCLSFCCVVKKIARFFFVVMMNMQ